MAIAAIAAAARSARTRADPRANSANMSGGLGSPPHGHAPLPDPRTPTAQPEDAQIRAVYGNFLRGVRRDIVRPFLMGAAAAFGMSLG